MGKLNNKKAFIIFGAAAVCISLAYWLSLLAQGKTVQAFVTPMDAEGRASHFVWRQYIQSTFLVIGNSAMAKHQKQNRELLLQ